MKNRMEIAYLTLEVTRRCNMTCPHCLRGEAQVVDMQKKTIDKVLDTFSTIGHVCFTGGEPTLNLPVIEYAFEQFRERMGYVPPFWIATNGKENQMELASILLRAYAECNDKEVCGVALSMDEFHEFVPKDKMYIKHLVFYDDSKERVPGMYWEEWVLPQGRAVDNGLVGTRKKHKLGRLNVSYEGRGDLACIEELVVTANENVYADCDYAYNDTGGILCSLDELPEYVEQNA